MSDIKLFQISCNAVASIEGQSVAVEKSLRAEIDEFAWSALYSTTSYPFDPPKTGRIAVKVINHYGDEVLKVYEVK